MRISLLTCCLLAGILAAHGADVRPNIAAERILQHTRVLASDEFEGRAPGSLGENKTVAYLVGEFKKAGLAPGNPNGSYVQAVPLTGIVSKTELAFTVNGKTRQLQPLVDFVGPSPRTRSKVQVAASDVVFVGYGVVAPEFDWDDFKGADVRGKTVIMLVNDPPVPDPADPTHLDPNVFGGSAMTYYGRWTYKYESAAARGAAACLIVHETEAASYAFSVVADSRGRENFSLRTTNGGADRVAVEGWLSLEATQALFAAAGQDFALCKQAAARRDFRPLPLKTKATFKVENTVRQITSRNIVARVPGADPKHRDEYVIYTTHWDHLGRNPQLSGDQIFNGAYDNASGTAALLEIARAFVRLPPDQRARRSVLFIATTAEEKGLLGATYYTTNPLYPLAQTLANINIDGINPLGCTADIEIVGAGATTIEALAASLAHAQNRTVQPGSRPERGGYFRADHFAFAKVGVPAFYPNRGRRYLDQSENCPHLQNDEALRRNYHKVTDEVQPEWTMEGGAQDATLLLLLGLEIANGSQWPQWLAGNQFKARREAMLATKP